MAQERIRKAKTEAKSTTEQEIDPHKTTNEETEKLKEYTDDLLEEIDGLLESNAAEFVKNFIQKGGQ